MKPVLQFLPNKLVPNARCVYKTDEMTLECEIRVPSAAAENHLLAESINQQFHLDKPSDLLLIADTLTLTFTGPDHHLWGLDAYTNKRLWAVSKFHGVPKVKGIGMLVVDPASFDGDRLALGMAPHYEEAASQEWVRIVFREDETAPRFKVANDLIAGLRDGMLTDIFALKVIFS